MRLIPFVLTAALAGGECDLSRVQPAVVCDTCREVNPPLDDRGLHCGAVPRAITVCVKTAYVCTRCGRIGRDPAPCCGAVPPEKREILSPIAFRCESCGRPGDREGPCPNPECLKSGRQIRQTCERSGTFPHSSEMEVRP